MKLHTSCFPKCPWVMSLQACTKVLERLKHVHLSGAEHFGNVAVDPTTSPKLTCQPSKWGVSLLTGVIVPHPHGVGSSPPSDDTKNGASAGVLYI
eukprot:6210368-Pleurochrysis_carterae.AAC.2